LIDRRSLFVSLLVSQLARAQAPKVFRIGWLGFALPTDPEVRELEDAFVEALRAQGFAEGRNIVIERRWTEGRAQQAASAAADFVQMKVDVIVVVDSRAAHAAKQATSTIPIVMVSVANPERQGLVASLGRPGGNVTGMSNMAAEFGGKTLQILKEVFPQRIRIAILWNPELVADVDADLSRAKALGMLPSALAVRSANDLEQAFETVIRERADVLIPQLALWAHRGRIQDFAAKQRLPTVTGARQWSQLGVLFSYGTDARDLFQRSAVYVANILRGAKPADLPVEQPTKFELVINMKTAKALGITIPASVLLRADQIIE
jgi:putative ABC transport system substrate-binding protein